MSTSPSQATPQPVTPEATVLESSERQERFRPSFRSLVRILALVVALSLAAISLLGLIRRWQVRLTHRPGSRS